MKYKFTQGYISLLSILIISSVTLIMLVGVFEISVGASKSLIVKNRGFQNYHLVNACGEVALQNIRQDETYQGSNSVFVSPEEKCTFTVTNTGGEGRVIIIETNSYNVFGNGRIVVDSLYPQITISTWEYNQ